MAGNSPPQASNASGGSDALKAITVNNQIREGILASAVEVKQQIFTQTIANPGSGSNVVQIPFRNVGLVKGFIVKVNATFAALTNAGDAMTLTPFNAANLLSNVTLYDLDNYQRINTTGWHLNMLGTAKEGFPHGAAILLSATDSPVKYGNNFNANTITAPVNGTAGSAEFYYWVPCAYSARDLRGAIFAGVVNATAYLNLTVNPNPFIAHGSDATNAVFTSSAALLGAAPTITSVTIEVYQVYLDQLPRYTSGAQAGSPILPPIDISTQYRLNQTSLQGVTVGQDFPIPFSNFQQFLSLSFIYDQAGTVNGGTDLNYLALAAANTYQLFKIDPTTQAWLSRLRNKTDWPLGTYMLDFRGAPVSTNQTGNMQVLVNAISAATGTQVLAGFESFALVNTVLGAASLPAS